MIDARDATGDTTPDYLAFGDLGIDSVARIDHLPAADEKLWVKPEGDFCGGMMGNAAATVSLLGVSAGVVALLGDDQRGDLVIDDLQRCGVDTRFIRRIHGPSFWTLSLTTPKGDRTLIQFPSPAFAANWDGFDRTRLAETKWVHTAAEQGEEVVRLFVEARRQGVVTSLDVEYPFVSREDLELLMSLTDVAFVNSAAANHLGGPAAGARRVHRMGAGAVIVTLGADGCLLVDPDGVTTSIPAVPIQAIDTNGAGDAFAGAFAVARLREWEHRRAAEFANLVAAVSTTSLGGHGAPLDRDTLRRVAREADLDWSGELP